MICAAAAMRSVWPLLWQLVSVSLQLLVLWRVTRCATTCYINNTSVLSSNLPSFTVCQLRDGAVIVLKLIYEPIHVHVLWTQSNLKADRTLLAHCVSRDLLADKWLVRWIYFMLYPFKRLKSLTHRQCTYAVIRTEPAKGQCRKKFLSRAHEVASRSHEMLSRGNERTSRAHELNYFPHVPSGAP